MSTTRSLSLGFCILLWSGLANASAPSQFGHGARSSALAQADIADPDATAAIAQNVALAAQPGLRLRVGYALGALDLRIDQRRAPVADVSGLDIAAQLGYRLPASFRLGVGIGAHLPDRQIASIGFRPGSEPQFVRYESSLQRATFDFAIALRRGPLALGAGATFAIAMGGSGTSFQLAQDARGTYASASTDITLPYRAAPLLGAYWDFGRGSLGISYRGALAVGVLVESDIRIALKDSPLNGTTHVSVTGQSGWDPARFAFGAQFRLPAGLSVLSSLEWQGFHAAPPPVADVTLDVALGTSPGRKEVSFVLPRFRDILVPRVGLEWIGKTGKPGGRRENGDQAIRYAARAGYSYSPSPVPPQRGFTSYADAASHTLAFGFGIGIGRHWGADLRADLAGQLSLLAARHEEKASAALPYASYDISGRVIHGALSLEGAFE